MQEQLAAALPTGRPVGEGRGSRADPTGDRPAQRSRWPSQQSPALSGALRTQWRHPRALPVSTCAL